MRIVSRSKETGVKDGRCALSQRRYITEVVASEINRVDGVIANGSACDTDADNRVDTRGMFSAGLAAQQLKWLGECKQVYAIPVSASSKNPFFDRKPKQ